MTYKKGYLVTPEMKAKRLAGQRVAFARRRLQMEESDIGTKWDLNNRPFFDPQIWENAKQSMNRPESSPFYSETELSIINLGAKLEKVGYFNERIKKKKKAKLGPGGILIPSDTLDLPKEEPTAVELKALEENNE